MGKKYLDTKKGSLESSVLGVWQTAIEEGDARETAVMDGRTKGYKSHRAKLEAARLRREERKKLSREEVELDEKIEYVEYLFKNKREAEFAKRYLGGQKEISFDFSDDNISQGELGVDAGDQDMTKHHNVVMKRWKPEIEVQEGSKLDEKHNGHNTHVDPKDRDELDKEVDGEGGVETAKKMKRSKEPAPNISEASGDKEAYKKFFDAALKKFKVSSPAELKGDQKKKFYDYIDAGWEGDNEKAEGAMSQVREFKIQSMKAALAQVWGMEEGKNPFAEHKGTKPHKHPHEENEKEMVKNGKTETGKKAAVIDLKPKIKD